LRDDQRVGSERVLDFRETGNVGDIAANILRVPPIRLHEYVLQGLPVRDDSRQGKDLFESGRKLWGAFVSPHGQRPRYPPRDGRESILLRDARLMMPRLDNYGLHSCSIKVVISGELVDQGTFVRAAFLSRVPGDA